MRRSRSRVPGVATAFSLAIVVAAAALLTAACGSTVPRSSPSETARAAPFPTSAPFDPEGVDLALAQFASGFDAPLFVTHAGDGSGRIFVVEQAGRVKFVTADGSSQGVFLDIADRVSAGGERGLLGLAFSPDFATDRQLFVDYTDLDGDTVVSRWTAPSSDEVDAGSEELVLRIDQPAPNHNGGWIGFGPDRMLYVAMGDGGGGNSANGQRLDTHLGKILRIDVVDDRPYSVPADNPKLGPGARPEIWLYGLRNPWRASFDRATGDLYIGDVGAASQEELDVIPRGRGGLNLGWPIAQGTDCTAPCPSGLSPPFYSYGRDVGSVVTGGYVYRGRTFPRLQGGYVFGDYGAGTISLISAADAIRGSAEPSEKIDTDYAISSFGEDEAGELYVTDLAGGGIYQVSVSAATTPQGTVGSIGKRPGTP